MYIDLEYHFIIKILLR